MKKTTTTSTVYFTLILYLFSTSVVVGYTSRPPKHNSLSNFDIYCKPKSRKSIYKRTYINHYNNNNICANSLSSSSPPSRGSSSSSSSSSSPGPGSSTPFTTSPISVLPNDNQFYDGYEDFIRNLQEDLENDSFDIYDNDDVIQDLSLDIEEGKDDDDDSSSIGGSSSRMNTKRSARKKSSSVFQPPKAFISSKPTTSNTATTNSNNPRKRRIPKYKRDMNDDMSISINEETVTKLIIERSKAQREKNYSRADAILSELNNDHGVYVWDRDRLWSVSPIAPSRRYNPPKLYSQRKRQNKYRQDQPQSQQFDTNYQYYYDGDGNNNQLGRNGHDYIQIGSGIDETVCHLELHEIHSLLAQRLEFKLIRKFDKADEIQARLYENGIRVHDKLKQWRGDGGIFADIEGMLSNKEYTMNQYSEVIEDMVTLDIIKETVSQWDVMKKKANYNEADRIRALLWDQYRVAVDDKSRTFSYGGDFGPNGTFRWTDDGPINPRKKKEQKQKDWRKVGMYTQSKLSEELDDVNDEEEVWNLIHDRLEARRVKDFDVADLIKDHLYTEYRISVDDQLRQWSVGGKFEDVETETLRSHSPTTADGKLKSSFVRVYNLRGGKGHLSEKEVALVEAMIKRRSEEMARYNQQAAESIRNGLKNKFYVIIDDVNGEWHVRGNDFCISPKLKEIPDAVNSSMKEIQALIRERSQAKGEGDFGRADEIRSDLFDSFGIILDDRLKEWTITINQANGPENIAKASLVEDSKVDQTSELERETLSKMTVSMLREKLKAAGLPVSGRKVELIDRLLSQS